jgi:hypothetical protein
VHLLLQLPLSFWMTASWVLQLLLAHKCHQVQQLLHHLLMLAVTPSGRLALQQLPYCHLAAVWAV